MLADKIDNSVSFPFRAPRAFLQRIKNSNKKDPLLRQVLPTAAENKKLAGFVLDPLNELNAQIIPGLIHKYQGRVLLTVTSECPIHCRFCFRRHFPFERNVLEPKNWQKILKYIRDKKNISEIIFSGGEPLIIPAQKLAELISDLSKISHVKRLRIHTRLPIVMPEKITTKLLQALVSSRLQVVMVLHCNHANEIDENVKKTCNKIIENRIIILNQSVLLRGVNDSVKVLADLSEKLFSIGVIPYYLHMLDKVTGVQHFAVSKKNARALMKKISCVLPGYLVPKLVEERPELPAKKLIGGYL
jgi:L-lysine 2,3-aminomutase